MISIICVFNDKKVLNEYLLESLKDQTAHYELILIDNTNRKFKSAPDAFNNGAKNAKGNYLMFVHQDVDLCSKNWVENVEYVLNSLSNLGIAGVAGKSKEGVVSNIKHGIPPILAGKIQIIRPTQVQTLDECLFILPKPVFNMYKFDEEICNDWHLYTVEYCLRVLKSNLNVFVIPNNIYHASAGYSISKSYFVILENLLRKYENDYKCIYTTVWNWNSSYSFSLQKIWYLIRLKISNFRRFLIRRWGIWEYHQ
jgi:hypothetical protein